MKSRIGLKNNGTWQEEDSFHQKIGLEFKKETSKVLDLGRNFVWC